MSKASTLQRVIDDIAFKNLGKARDRLLGLVREYPNDLELRHILGRVFLELQYPKEAGRFLYLVDDKSETVRKAIREFERSCQNDLHQIFKVLKLQGPRDSFEEGYGKDKILELIAALREKRKHPLWYVKKKRGGPRSTPKNDWVGGWFVVLLVFVVISLIVGVIRILIWIYKFFEGLFT